jgi:carbonic anhydrase
MTKILAIFSLIFFSSCSKNWSYSGKFGPQNWGNLKEEFKFCKIGYNQSPINIEGEFKNEELDFFYGKSEVEKTPTKHLLQLKFHDKDFVSRLKRQYLIRHIEFHHPSEHLVNGAPHSLEMQIYHKSDNEQWLAVAFFLEVGQENSGFEQLVKFLSSKEMTTKLDLSKLLKKPNKLFFYDGSFTTPPCKEGLKWYVAKTPITISKEQMNQIIKLTIFSKNNARPAQSFHPERF